MFIDTPGIGDSEGRDTENIASIVECLKRVGYVHTFAIVINSEEPRFNDQLQQTITLFISMFGEAFLTHTMLCFTKYATDPKSVRQRQSGGKKKDTHIIAEYQKLFYDRYNQFMLKSDQFMFIDSIVDNDEDADENE